MERKTWLLNYGMGVDSTTILARWILEPETRPFESLDDLVVLTAQTGDEFWSTKIMVETYVLPLLRTHGIRFVQVAKGGPAKADGYTVLSDSRETQTCYIEGDYRLSQNLVGAGTVPRLGRPHICAIRWKGDVLDPWIGDHIAGAIGPAIGYNADELKRAAKSNDYGCRSASYFYPLIEWGWGRERCVEYLQQTFGVKWPKSCCYFCPFQPDFEACERWKREPLYGAEALWVAGFGMAFNPRMHLLSTGSALESAMANHCTDAIHLYQDWLQASPWAVYRVRRIYTNTGTSSRTQVNARRDVSTVWTGDQAGALQTLNIMAINAGAEVVLDGEWYRAYTHTRATGYPAIEEFLVACPWAPQDKCQHPKNFQKAWGQLSGQTVQLTLI
ncbi:MAG: hypothetical protein ACHWZW_02785 [Spirulina sp.]